MPFKMMFVFLIGKSRHAQKQNQNVTATIKVTFVLHFTFLQNVIFNFQSALKEHADPRLTTRWGDSN